MRRLLIVASILIVAAVPAAAQQILVTEAGAGPTGLPATAANVAYPGALHRSASGELLIMTDEVLLQVDPSGAIRVLAGQGVNCTVPPYGDGGPALYSCLSAMGGLTRETGKGVTRDAAGNIYIADTGHHVIRRIDAATGVITKWAGTYTGSYGGDGGPASGASLYRPHQIVFDAAGNMLIADRGNHRIRRISAATGVITTVAGNGTRTASIDGEFGNPADDLGDGLPATEASLNLPWGVAVDAAGNFYIGDSANHRVRKVNAATGVISTIAGNGIFGYGGEDVSGTAATLAGPSALSIDSGGNLLIADSQTDLYNILPEEDQLNHHIRRLNLATGIITTVAGTDGFGYTGPNGDGGPATSAALYRPCHAISDAAGDVYIADQWHLRVRKVTAATGIIDNFAGNGTSCYAGDGYPAKSARLCGPGPLEFDAAGNLYIADQYNGRVRRVSAASGIITTVAGDGGGKTSGDGGPAVAAGLQWPAGIAFDSSGNLYIADGDAHRVRKVTLATGIITTVAGNGTPGFGGDGGQAKQALLHTPSGVALNTAGDLFIADSENNRVRKVSAATGIISTVAGTGWAYNEYDGPGGSPIDDINDGGSATNASVSYPMDVVVDSFGSLLIADWEHRVRKVSTSGIISTIAGTGQSGSSGDGGPATSATVSPEYLGFDAAGNLFLTSGRRIRRIDSATGIISTVLGNDASLFMPDGTAAPVASLVFPWGMAVDPGGRVHCSEAASDRVRTVVPSPGASMVPDGHVAGERPLTVTRAANGDLTLTWGSSCMSTDYDYAIYEGTLGSLPSHLPRFCSTGGALTKTFTPPAGNAYYLVVPRNGVEEGSYGLAGDGSQTPPSVGACVPQHVATQCQ